ncbi:cell division protein FtsQ/DivIB [Candidatus Liberibacter sp.]|uniref:cell division protein FtsQ/DivIB n=1 Tax=Candidatus Liberibacter sp. TaxID=34022 RepID=UPI0028709887|nr:cell division protein FtsQ/DivIB [Candidatus Liberibacter sp.]
MPPYCEILVTILFFSTIGIYGAFVGGHTHLIVDILDSISGFSVEKVRIIGNIETSEVDVVRRLGLNKDTSLIAFDILAVQKKLLQLPWVSRAEIHKIYPDTIEIHLTERRPHVIWQHDSELFLIEKNGEVIEPLKGRKFSHLPMLVGQGANKEVESFEKFLAKSKIAPLIKAYVLVSKRRWDLHLRNGIVVHLPEEGFVPALSKLLAVQDKYKILERDIAAIDLRLPDRIAIRLTASSFIDRQEVVNLREKFFDRGYRGR